MVQYSMNSTPDFLDLSSELPSFECCDLSPQKAVVVGHRGGLCFAVVLTIVCVYMCLR